ncbi:MAG: MBL fold metallo-hydrolase [Bacteroidota bacterium]
MTHKYVALHPDGDPIYLFTFDPDEQEFKKAKHVLWGDWLRIDEHHDFSQVGPGWTAVIWAPNTANKIYYIKTELTTDQRPLEIIFLDVGQGDGAVLITPEDGENEKIMVIDAGEGNNMARFLNGRFKAYRGFDFEAAIITHPDADHYRGFEEIFANHNIGFKMIYQNGLVERPVSGTFDKVGGVVKDNGVFYMEDLAMDKADIEQHFSDDTHFGQKQFPPVMFNALNNPKILDFKMLSTDPNQSVRVGNRAYMPGFEPLDQRKYSIEVLGPIMEYDGNDKPRLRRISSNYGKTKNGHSIILRLHFGKYKVLFGGDLNIPAEKYLLRHYAGLDKFPAKSNDNYQLMLDEASKWFKAEIMKVCHHGSEKVTDEFMQVVNPACFVISSGDEEGHVHPRPDLLGRLGRFGRGESPVILSTELQRSTREFEDQKKVDALKKDIDELAQTEEPTEDLVDSIKDKIAHLGRTNVDVYGAVYLKTDGERLITAFKFEEASDKKKWFYYEYQIDDNGELHLRD